MQTEILLNGISFEQLQNSIQTTVSTEFQKLIDQLFPKEPTDTTPELLTRKQTAQILGISLVTLNVWTKNGIIPAKRIGGSVRYEKHTVYDSLKDIKTLKYRRA